MVFNALLLGSRLDGILDVAAHHPLRGVRDFGIVQSILCLLGRNIWLLSFWRLLIIFMRTSASQATKQSHSQRTNSKPTAHLSSQMYLDSSSILIE